MKAKDKPISDLLEWTQQGLDAIEAMPPKLRDRLAEDERKLHEQKRNLEKRITRNEA